MEVDCATTDRVGRGNGSIREPSWGARPNRARAGLIGRIACGTGLWTLINCVRRSVDAIRSYIFVRSVRCSYSRAIGRARPGSIFYLLDYRYKPTG